MERPKSCAPKSDFRYDRGKDVYVCPAGQTLYPRRYDKRRKATEYKAYKNVCAGCELRASRTKSVNGRTIMRHFGQELIDQAVEQSKSAEAYRNRIRRRYLMEGSFAQGTNLHHFKRSRWRRLGKQRMQDWIICAIQNIRILIKRSPPPKTAAESPVRAKIRIQNTISRFKTAILALARQRKTLTGFICRPPVFRPVLLPAPNT